MIINDQKGLLTQSQIQLLQKQIAVPYAFGGFQSMDDILAKLNVPVRIEPGIKSRTVPTWLVNEREVCRKEIERLRENNATPVELKPYYDKQDAIGGTINGYSSMALLGEYIKSPDTIILYPDAMMALLGGSHMDELLVSTLAHEAMHAYFDRPGHKQFPYALFVEEPLAEFGMLLYLNNTGSTYYNWAYSNVSRKRTCYGFGAWLMDLYLSGQSTLKNYMENYKINIPANYIPQVDFSNKTIVMPNSNVCTIINGKTIVWQNVFPNPPRYFYDSSTSTLYLDGDWSQRLLHNNEFDVEIDIHILHLNVNIIYLGDHFELPVHYGPHHPLGEAIVKVSPANKMFKEVNGFPVYRHNNLPGLDECGSGTGMYKMCRNGLWGVVDESLNQVIPCKYGYVWNFDENGLIMVCNTSFPRLYGLVDKSGQEIVPLIYEDIDDNDDGTYTVKYNGEEYIINNVGQRK